MAVGFDFDPDNLADPIETAVDTFDFTLPGQAGGTLGEDLASTAAIQIGDRSRRGLKADKTPFDPNEPKYAEYKQVRYDDLHPGTLGGQMLNETSLLGKPTVSPTQVLMTYGWGVPSPRSTALNGVTLKRWELAATDRDKATWFTDSGRPFYELDPEISEALVKLCDEAFAKHLKEVV